MINSFLEKIFNSIPDTLGILIVLGFSLLALVLAIIISFSLIRVILRIKWKNQTIKKLIRIRNDGNVCERFLVRINVPETELAYQCLLEGKPLPKSEVVQRILIKPEKEELSLSSVGAAVGNKSSTESTTGSYQSEKLDLKAADQNDAKKKLDDSAAKAKDKAKKGMGFVRLASGILGSLGSILPGSIGGSFKDKANELQKASQDASSKMQMPEQKLRSVEQLKSQVGKINPQEKDQKDKPKSNSVIENLPLQSQEIAGKTLTQPVPIAPKQEFREISMVNYYETPALRPGNVHHLDLSFDPLHPYQTKEYFIEAFIQQMVSDKAYYEEEPGYTKTHFNIFIKGLSPIFWILVFLLVLCTVIINSTWAVLFISWLARFVI